MLGIEHADAAVAVVIVAVAAVVAAAAAAVAVVVAAAVVAVAGLVQQLKLAMLERQLGVEGRGMMLTTQQKQVWWVAQWARR